MEKTVVLLVGPQGSGKSTYCTDNLSGSFRVSQDEQGRQHHVEVLEEALKRGEPGIVIDRINAIKAQRKRYLDLARQYGYRTRIVWLNVDFNTCLKRCRARADHPTLRPEDADKALRLYFNSFQIPSKREADALVILGPPPEFVPVVDLCESIGTRRHLIVGDIHGCLDELRELLNALRFDPANDVLISVGDIIDRGPKIRETVEYLFALPSFHMTLGNHEYKLLRYLQGHKVQPTGGLRTTVDAFGDNWPDGFADRLAALPLIVKTPAGYVVHAGFDPERPPEEQGRADCIYMRFYGGKTYFDEINGRPWYTLWPRDYPRVFFGHIPIPDGPRDVTVALDGGCVFGGVLRIFDSRDGQVHEQKAHATYAVSDVAHVAPTTSAEAVQRREEYVVAGHLRTDRTDDGRLAIYTYTDSCVYDNAWDDVTRNSRGHIYDLQTGECVAFPFLKFFNLGENQVSLPDQFPWHEPYEIYEKMDGWLGVLYRHEGKFQVASRGSFHSTGARWASEHIQGFDLSCLPLEATLCFEIIHPEHKIILDYAGDKRLMILGAFNRFTGQEYPRHVVADWSRRTGLPLVPLLAPMSLEELLHTKKNREKVEGFVIRFADGRRVKVKTDWYLGMAQIMSNLTPIALWEVMVQGKVRPDFLVKVPEELRPLAERYRAILEGQYARLLHDIDHAVAPILEQHGQDRRALARHLDENKATLGSIKSACFLLLDGKRDRLEKLIMDRIYPAGNRFVKD